MTATAKPKISQMDDSVSKSSLSYQLLINGNFDIWQERTSIAAASLADGVTYICDQWYNVQSTTAKWGVAIDAGASVALPSGSTYGLQCVTADANIQMGIIQPVEFLNASKYRGKQASVSFYARTTAGKVISNLRCALINWTGTADTLTKDIVQTWAGNGTNPTLIANATMLNTPSNLTLATSWTRYKIENITVPSTVNNLLLFIWVDDTTITSGDEWYISQVQVNEGTTSLPFYPKGYNIELTDCMRYWEKSYSVGAYPGGSGIEGNGCFALAYGTGALKPWIQFKVGKRIAPSVINIYSYNGTLGKVCADNSTSDIGGTVTAPRFGSNGILEVTGTGAPFTNGLIYWYNWTASARL